MYELIAANPFFLIATSGFLTAILIFMYMQTHDVRIRPFIIGGVILTVLPFITDKLIETDREKIKTSIQRIARSVRMNDIESTLSYAHPDSKAVYERIKAEMPNYDFSMCTVSGIRNIAIDEKTREAIVKFTVFVNVDAKRGPEGVGNRGITLRLKQDNNDGKWKMTDYRHYLPMSKNTDLDSRLN